MATTLTPNLKLRVSDNATADAVHNLYRIDSLASVFTTTAVGDVNVRSQQALVLEANSLELGGTGTGGSISLGTSSHDMDSVNLYATTVNSFGNHVVEGTLEAEGNILVRDQVRWYNDAETLYVGFKASDSGLSGNTVWTLPTSDGTVNQVMRTDGAGNLSWVTVSTDALQEFHVKVGNSSDVAVEVDTSSLGDISATSTGGFVIKPGVIVNADIASAAAIARSKLATGAIDHVIINDSVTGALSSEPQLAISRGGTAASTASGARTSFNIRALSTTWAPGDGATKVITHNFNTANLLVQVIDNTDEIVLVDTVEYTNANTVTLTSSQAPAGTWYVLVKEVQS